MLYISLSEQLEEPWKIPALSICLIHCNNSKSLNVIFSFLEALPKIIFPKFLHFEMLPQKHLRLKVKLIHLQIAHSEKNKT